jgi:hypothetical protein
MEKYTIVYRTKEVTLIDGTIKGYRVTVYQDPTMVRVSFLPYSEELAATSFSQHFQDPTTFEDPKDLLEYVEFFAMVLE